MKIQLDIPDGLNRKLKIYRIKKKMDSLKEVIISLLKKSLRGEKL